MLDNPKKAKLSFLNKIKWLSICPFCQTKFSLSQAKIIAEKKDSFLVHAYCSNCKCSLLASLIANPMGVSSIGLVTDLTYEDILRFRQAPSIMADDLINLYQTIQHKGKLKIKI